MLNPLLISHTLLATTILQLLPISVAAIPTVPKSTTNRAPFNSANEGPIHDYTIEPITFQIPTSPSLNSPTINVTGTIQQAIQAAEKVNPAWRSDFAQATIQKFKSQNLLAAVEVDHWDCSTGAPTGYNDVSESLWAVALTKGKPSLGPGRCGRVSCQEGAAVWWCNNSVGVPLCSTRAIESS